MQLRKVRANPLPSRGKASRGKKAKRAPSRGKKVKAKRKAPARKRRVRKNPPAPAAKLFLVEAYEGRKHRFHYYTAAGGLTLDGKKAMHIHGERAANARAVYVRKALMQSGAAARIGIQWVRARPA